MFFGTWMHMGSACMAKKLPFSIEADTLSRAAEQQIIKHQAKVVFCNSAIVILEIDGIKRLAIADAPLFVAPKRNAKLKSNKR
ncbi:hypothetical protein ACV2M4_001131 [Shigella sonnei]